MRNQPKVVWMAKKVAKSFGLKLVKVENGHALMNKFGKLELTYVDGTLNTCEPFYDDEGNCDSVTMVKSHCESIVG